MDESTYLASDFVERVTEKIYSVWGGIENQQMIEVGKQYLSIILGIV